MLENQISLIPKPTQYIIQEIRDRDNRLVEVKKEYITLHKKYSDLQAHHDKLLVVKNKYEHDVKVLLQQRNNVNALKDILKQIKPIENYRKHNSNHAQNNYNANDHHHHVNHNTSVLNNQQPVPSSSAVKKAAAAGTGSNSAKHMNVAVTDADADAARTSDTHAVLGHHDADVKQPIWFTKLRM